MAKYRKKPVIIDAEPVTKLLRLAKTDWAGLPKWVKENYENGNIIFLDDSINIKTLSGNVDAVLEDMVIRGGKGEIYPCKPHIFQETYEPII